MSDYPTFQDFQRVNVAKNGEESKAMIATLDPICNLPIDRDAIARDLVLLRELEALLLQHSQHDAALTTVRSRIAELEGQCPC